jgi:GNAT superfamily N-acetyltransferase
MTQSDPVTSARDIHTLSEEYQTVGAALVEDLYWHLVDRNGRGVTMDQAREYIGRLTGRFRREILRSWLDHLAPGPFARANSAEHEPRGTVDDARESLPGRVDPPPARSDRAQRQSLGFQDAGSPYTAYLLSRAAGVDPAGLTNAELLTRAAGRHAVELPARRVAPPKSGSPPPIGRRVDPRQPDPPGGRPSVPSDPARNPSFGDIPSAGEALTRTVGRRSSDSGEGLTGTAGEPGLSPPPVATGWHALTSEEATRHDVERGLSDDTIRQQLAPWLNDMTNAEYRDWEALLAELRGQGLGEPLLGREPPDFMETPDARLLAQAIAFQARHNADRMRRARLAAPAYLRAALGREPIPVEVEAWANTLFSRNDTVIEVNSRQPTVAERDETVPALQRGPGRPGWTRDLFEEHWREARAATPLPHTFRALAEHFRALDGFEGGLGGEHLRKLRRKRFPE